MSNKTLNYAAWATMHLGFALITLWMAIFGSVAAHDQYAAHANADVVVVVVTLLLAAPNLVLFIIRITQMIDEVRRPEPEIDEELEEAYDQLEAASILRDGDEIVRDDDDDQLYLCLDNGGTMSVDLLLVKDDAGRWQLYVPGDERSPVPVEYVEALRERIRQQDEQITSEIKGLSPQET